MKNCYASLEKVILYLRYQCPLLTVVGGFFSLQKPPTGPGSYCKYIACECIKSIIYAHAI